MALEDLTGPSKFITALVPGNPVSADDRREGDDHIRGVKNVLRNSFPLLDGPLNFDLKTGPYLPLAGGTLTGNLVIAPAANPVLALNAPAGQTKTIRLQSGGSDRWIISCKSDAETGSNAGSNFTIDRHNDSGVGINTALNINRANGLINITGSVTAGGIINANAVPELGWKFLSVGNGAMGFFGTAGAVNTMVLQKDNTQSSYLNFLYGPVNGTNGTLVGYIATANGTTTTYSTSSDYRLKKDVSGLNGLEALATVRALLPRRFTWKATGQHDVGFIAHELAEQVPSAVSGEKDALDEDGQIVPQGADLSFIVPFLVGAVQELAERLEALGAR